MRTRECTSSGEWSALLILHVPVLITYHNEPLPHVLNHYHLYKYYGGNVHDDCMTCYHVPDVMPVVNMSGIYYREYSTLHCSHNV